MATDTTPKPITYATPKGGWDPNSVVDYVKSTGGAATHADLTKLATANGITGYTGSSAQNQALLAKLKGYGGTTNAKSISGSSSVTQGKQAKDATSSAASSLNQNAATGGKTTTTTPPSPTDTNPIVQEITNQTNTAIQQAKDDASVELKPITDAHLANISTLQNQMTQAVASAKAQYAKANPYGSGSDEEQFVNSIKQSYDTQIANANNQYNDQVMQIHQGLNDNINSINSTYQQNIAAYKQQSFENLNKMLDITPPDIKKIGSLLAGAISGNQKDIQSLQDYLGGFMQEAEGSGQFQNEDGSFNAQAALAYITNPTVKEQQLSIDQDRLRIEEGQLSVSEENAQTSRENAQTARENAQTAKDNASSTTTTTKSTPLLWGLIHATSTSQTQKNPGTDNSDDVSSYYDK